eukprot:726794-Prymnesium_polylepis.2
MPPPSETKRPPAKSRAPSAGPAPHWLTRGRTSSLIERRVMQSAVSWRRRRRACARPTHHRRLCVHHRTASLAILFVRTLASRGAHLHMRRKLRPAGSSRPRGHSSDGSTSMRCASPSARAAASLTRPSPHGLCSFPVRSTNRRRSWRRRA